MYSKITKKYFENNFVNIVIPYLSVIFLLTTFFVLTTLYKTYTGYIVDKIDYNNRIVKIEGTLNEIDNFNVYLRFKEEFPDQVVVPITNHFKDFDGYHINLIATSEDFFKYNFNLESSNSTSTVIQGSPVLITNKVVINKALFEQIEATSYTNINGEELIISAVIDDHVFEPRIYFDYKYFDINIKNIHETLINGSLVYVFNEIQLLFDDVVREKDINKVNSLLGNSTMNINITTKDLLINNELKRIGIGNKLNDYIFILFLVVSFVVLFEVVYISIKNRTREFYVYRVLGQSNFRLIKLSLIENIVSLIISVITSMLLGIFFSKILITSLRIKNILININILLQGYIAVFATVIIMNYLISMYLLNKKSLVKRG